MVNKGKISDKIINVVLNILIFIFGVVLLISIYNNIQVKLLGNDYSSFFGYSVFEVQTGSMGEAVEPGDWIVVKYSRNIKIDDIVTFKQDGDFITHRVIEAYQGTFVTKGDANDAKDDPITQEQIVGKVVKILPAFGIFKKTIFNPIVLIAIIITIYLVNLTFKKNKKEKKMSKLDIIVANIMKKLKIFSKNIIKLIKKDNKKIVNDNYVKEELKPKEVIKNNIKEENNEVKVTKVEEVKDENIDETITDLKPLEAEDLDKTMYFRMIQVDKDEIENAYAKKIEVEEEPVVVEKDEEEKVDEVELKLEMLQNKKKKFKNIIEKVMFMKEEEIKEIIDVLNNGESLKTNEATIKDNFLKIYIDGKYYNYCGDINVEYNGRNMNVRLETALKESAEKMLKSYKGTDNKYSEKVKKYTNIFTLLIHLEHTYLVIDDNKIKKQTYKNKMIKYIGTEVDPKTINEMISKILKIQKTYKSAIKVVLEKLETTLFELNYNALSIKNIYAVELNHNINFSKVYSDYIVDKTYSDGIVAEDKIEVLLTLLLIQIVKDMLNADFNKKYIFYLPESLYTKTNKLDKIFNLFADEYAKNNIIVLAQYEELSKNKKIIKTLIKDGYKFAVDLKASKVNTKDQGVIEAMEYIFIDKRVKGKMFESIDVLSSIKEELHNKIAYDDIASKVGSYWGN